jgi:hypothetical protein
MGELQKFVNTFLGQKVYRAEYIGYIDVYARSEEWNKELKLDNTLSDLGI